MSVFDSINNIFFYVVMVVYMFYNPTDSGAVQLKQDNSDMTLDGSLVRVFSGHGDGITCLAVSWCGKYLLSGSRDKKVILWDIAAGKAMLKLTGHEKAVYSVGFCWFGSVVASCGADNTVRLYDRSDPKGTCLGVYQTKNTPLHCVNFRYRNIISVVGPYNGS